MGTGAGQETVGTGAGEAEWAIEGFGPESFKQIENEGPVPCSALQLIKRSKIEEQELEREGLPEAANNRVLPYIPCKYRPGISCSICYVPQH